MSAHGRSGDARRAHNGCCPACVGGGCGGGVEGKGGGLAPSRLLAAKCAPSLVFHAHSVSVRGRPSVATAGTNARVCRTSASPPHAHPLRQRGIAHKSSAVSGRWHPTIWMVAGGNHPRSQPPAGHDVSPSAAAEEPASPARRSEQQTVGLGARNRRGGAPRGVHMYGEGGRGEVARQIAPPSMLEGASEGGGGGTGTRPGGPFRKGRPKRPWTFCISFPRCNARGL